MEDPPQDLTYESFKNVVNSLSISINYASPPESNKKYTIIGSKPQELTRFIDPTKNILRIYKLVNKDIQKVFFSIPEEKDQSKIESAVKMGDVVSSINYYAGYGTDVSGILGLASTVDPTGSIIKFSYISKLVSRLRYIDINFGEIFGTYL
jgi:hypothetical protein